MGESVAVAKEVDAKKSSLSTRNSSKSIHHVQNEHAMQLGSLGGVISNIRSNGDKPSVESIATQLSGMPTGEHAPALLALQQTHGNRYVQRVVAGIQAKLVVGQPGDKYEQEADRVADAVMRIPEIQRQVGEEGEELLQTKPLVDQITPVVQRQVEEEEEEEMLQAKNREDATSEVTNDLESQINAIKGGGRPLAESERAFFEPRFVADFSQVRVHTGVQAAESARALNARAFTMERNIVFGDGQYTPSTISGRYLLAHELVHTIQQGHYDCFAQHILSAGLSDGVHEYHADAMAGSVMSHHEDHQLPILSGDSVESMLQRESADDESEESGSVEVEMTPQTIPRYVCGPDVTAQITTALSNVRSTFGGWIQVVKEFYCDRLDSPLTWSFAWDIINLHNNAWIHQNYRPTCATAGATPSCGSSVQVGGECYYAGSANYVVFGLMCKLCFDHYVSTLNPQGVIRFTKSKMLRLINYHKGTGFSGLATPAANFAESQQWAAAGYDGWPSGGTPPAGDRSNCSPLCPTQYSGGAFRVLWFPHII